MKMCSDKKRIIAGSIFTAICIGLFAIGICGCVHIRRDERQEQIKAAGLEDAGQSDRHSTGSGNGRDITPESVTRTMEEILLWQCDEYGVSDVQELLDTAYAGRAANGTVQTYVLGLYGYQQKYDYARYVASVQNALREGGVGTMSLQKSTMVLSALQADNPVPVELLEATVGQQGMMSDLYGLLMLHGMTETGGGQDALVQEILSRQLADGGFAIAGTEGDVDVTAMALQALAPYYWKAKEHKSSAAEDESGAQTVQSGMKNDVGLMQAVENALAFLSKQQLATGDFANGGTPNAESTAQVILALCALEQDAWTEAAFIKDGVTVWDGLSRYRNADGGFSHTEGAASNDMATSQVFAALSAVNRLMSGECFLFDFQQYEREITEEQSLPEAGGSPGMGQEEPAQDAANQEMIPDVNEISETPEQEGIPANGMDLRAALIALILAADCGYLAYLCYTQKYSRKRLGGILTVTAVLAAAVCFIRIQTREAYLRQDNGRGGDGGITVTMEIRCDTVAGAEDFLPQDGVILAKVPVSAVDGESAFDVLREAARIYDIPVEYEGTAAGDEFAYVEGIAYLYEYDYGELSGWIFLVNGETPNVGCGAYQVADGDEIVWFYTLELGRDVKQDL